MLKIIVDSKNNSHDALFLSAIFSNELKRPCSGKKTGNQRALCELEKIYKELLCQNILLEPPFWAPFVFRWPQWEFLFYLLNRLLLISNQTFIVRYVLIQSDPVCSDVPGRGSPSLARVNLCFSTEPPLLSCPGTCFLPSEGNFTLRY